MLFYYNKENCDTYVYMKYGDDQEHEINDSTYVIKNTSEPIYGRAFSREINFPSNSQLTVGIKDQGSSKILGKTTIDLENRFYSKCYANCGLPDRFELSGFNYWRDSRLPSEILIYQCRKCKKKMNFFKNFRYVF